MSFAKHTYLVQVYSTVTIQSEADTTAAPSSRRGLVRLDRLAARGRGEDVTLQDFVGKTYLFDARGEGTVRPGVPLVLPANAYAFRFDGRIYLVREDESDGYRSSHDDVREATAEDLETITMVEFPTPLVVHCVHRTVGQYHTDDDVLVVINDATDLVIMEIGTTNTNDYYPSFHFRWLPEGEPYVDLRRESAP